MGWGEIFGLACFMMVVGLLALTQFTTRWHTWGFFLTLSFVIIPVIFFIMMWIIAYPPLLILLLIIAFAGANQGR